MTRKSDMETTGPSVMRSGVSGVGGAGSEGYERNTGMGTSKPGKPRETNPGKTRDITGPGITDRDGNKSR